MVRRSLQSPPIVLIVLTDDQPEAMTGAMPGVQSELVKKGLVFENAFATTPLCCPSRATLLSGKYAHNHGIFVNFPPEAGAPAFEPSEGETVATALDPSYRTAYFGKYLNSVKGSRIPRGWDRWFAFTNFGYKDGGDYEVNAQGTVRSFDENSNDSTDLLAQKAERFVGSGAGEPWFAVVATYDPYGPYSTAERNRHAHDGLPLLEPPSFREDTSDKPGWVRRGSFSGKEVRALRRANEMRAESLRDVDDLVVRLTKALEETGQADNTYVFFTSDNGLHCGEHRLTAGASKKTPYEESVGVPLIVRGPGWRRVGREGVLRPRPREPDLRPVPARKPLAPTDPRGRNGSRRARLAPRGAERLLG